MPKPLRAPSADSRSTTNISPAAPAAKAESQVEAKANDAETPTTTESSPKSVNVIPGLGIHHEVLTGCYDIPELDIGNGLVLDIGANVGAFVLWAKMRWPDCRVHAYEPCKATYDECVSMVAQIEGVRVHHAAVTDIKAPKLRYGVNCSAENSIHQIGHQGEPVELVPTVSPGSLPDAEFVKIDTEGCEVEILETYIRRGRWRPRAIVLEWHSGEDRKRLKRFIAGLGYRIQEIPNVILDLVKGVNVGIIKAYARS